MVNVHEKNIKENFKDVTIYLVDLEGNQVINANNSVSYLNANLPLFFKQNYIIETTNNKERWYFPQAKDQYILLINNTVNVEDFQVKVEVKNGKYKNQIIPISSINTFVLCTNQIEQQKQAFGRKVTNEMIEVILE